MWAHRPATDEMLDAACKNVKYLCSLRCVMMEKLLKDFISATDIYLAAFRDAPDKELADLVQFSEIFISETNIHFKWILTLDLLEPYKTMAVCCRQLA